MTTLLVILIILFVVAIILFAKPMWLHLTTKREAEKDYYNIETDVYFTKEEMTKKMEAARKREIVVVLLAITSPFWIYFLAELIWYLILIVGTIFFCIELLAKGSGIK